MPSTPPLRHWNFTHIDEHIPHLTGYHENELFYNCTIDDMSGATLVNCCMTQSKLTADSLEQISNLAMTFDCHSFTDAELSPLAFDFLLALLIKSKGNDERRQQLVNILGRDRLVELLLKARR